MVYFRALFVAFPVVVLCRIMCGCMCGSIPGKAARVYRGVVDPGGVSPENSAQNKKNSPNPTRSQRPAIFVKRPTQVKLVLDSDGQYDCNERKRAEIFVNHLAANMVLDESTNSFANRPTKHIILAILTAKNKAANLNLDDSEKTGRVFIFRSSLTLAHDLMAAT